MEFSDLPGAKCTGLVMQVQVERTEDYDHLLKQALEQAGNTVVEHFGGKHFTCLHATTQVGEEQVPLYLDVLRPEVGQG